jgi:hypothetical protein
MRGSAFPSNVQLDDFRFDEAGFNPEPADAHWQFESPRPRAARIEVKHSFTHFLLGNMAVAGNHDLESGGFRLEIELCEIVEHIDRDTSKFDDFILRQLTRPWTFIDVAADRSKRCDGRELLEDLRVANISCVDDVLRSEQRLEGLRAKQAM